MNEQIHMDAVYLEGGDILLDPRPCQFFDARRGRFCVDSHTIRMRYGPVRICVCATFAASEQFTGLGRFFLQ